VRDFPPAVDQQSDLAVDFLGESGQIVGQFGCDDLPGGELTAVNMLKLF
jgi:hypothetical protein